jgi:hypothetical protein
VHIAPIYDRHHDRIEAETLLRKDAFIALGRLHVGNAPENSEAYQPLKPLREQVPGDPGRPLEGLKPPFP